ncbi:7543_t:CDS:2 [Paraglomus occultum]|uniref:7543_t:CDS:1 n=1 Tax=Paraglomus occultum TaxID=144539 RepID=A0A9N9F294_9GLOM|nr:7543_t:CDS:2 [Paraglomus occultum]
MSRQVLISERALLQTRLPSTMYEESIRYYCFQRGSRTPPRSVRHWHSFVEDVRRYEVSDYSIFAPLNLRNDTVQIFDEGTLLCLMDTTVLSIIRSIWDHRSVSLFRIRDSSRVDWHITDDDGRAIVCISLKPCWALTTNNNVDAVQEYERGENDFHDYVNNMYDYMLNLGIRYGILTTYDNTWFMRRSFEDESVLEISQCHNIETDHLLLLSWNYIIHLGNVSRPCHPNPDYYYDSYNNENNTPDSVSDNSDYDSNETSSGEQSSDEDVNYLLGRLTLDSSI